MLCARIAWDYTGPMSFSRQLVIPGLELVPTIALARGDASLKQCAQCGTVVYVPSSPTKLGPCPSCRHGEWWTQTLPVGPFHEATP